MKPPKCRNCGVMEWRHVCSGSVFSPASSRVKPDAKTKTAVRVPAPRAEAALATPDAVSQLATSTYRYRDVEARRAYQRDLMRSRRRAARRVAA